MPVFSGLASSKPQHTATSVTCAHVVVLVPAQLELSALHMPRLRNCFAGLAHALGIPLYRSHVPAFSYWAPMEANITDVLHLLGRVGVVPLPGSASPV